MFVDDTSLTSIDFFLKKKSCIHSVRRLNYCLIVYLSFFFSVLSISLCAWEKDKVNVCVRVCIYLRWDFPHLITWSLRSVAHSEQYGYGFRPFEFMAPEDGANATLARQVELHHGLYALRSFLVPQAYVTVTWFLHVLGFNFPPFVVRQLYYLNKTNGLIIIIILRENFLALRRAL